VKSIHNIVLGSLAFRIFRNKGVGRKFSRGEEGKEKKTENLQKIPKIALFCLPPTLERG